MDKEFTIHQILDALSGGDIDLERKVKLLYCNVEAMHRGVKLIHLAMNCEIEQFRQGGIEIPKITN